jgi:hypothetical protein
MPFVQAMKMKDTQMDEIRTKMACLEPMQPWHALLSVALKVLAESTRKMGWTVKSASLTREESTNGKIAAREKIKSHSDQMEEVLLIFSHSLRLFIQYRLQRTSTVTRIFSDGKNRKDSEDVVRRNGWKLKLSFETPTRIETGDTSRLVIKAGVVPEIWMVARRSTAFSVEGRNSISFTNQPKQNSGNYLRDRNWHWKHHSAPFCIPAHEDELPSLNPLYLEVSSQKRHFPAFVA